MALLLLTAPTCCCLHCGYLQERITPTDRLVCPGCETVLSEPIAASSAKG